jgi:DNA-binding transcriptional LysR family regulator
MLLFMQEAYMDLRDCRHLVTLAKCLSFTKAADELGLSQPALSRSIQAIERRAKVRLFDRDRSGVHLTPMGRKIVDRAADLLREADDLSGMIRRMGSGDDGDIAFGMAPLPAKALLPKLLPEELRSAAHCYVSVRNPDALLAQLVADEIEFLVCPDNQFPQGAPVKASLIGMFPISLLVRANHPVLRAPSGDARRYPLLLPRQLGDTASLSAYVRAYINDASPIVIEDYGVLAPITQHSDGMWLWSAAGAEDEIREGRLKEVPPLPGQKQPTFKMMMYSHTRRSLSPTALRLKARLQAIAKALV